MIVNERLKKLRKTLDLTQKEFGERIGVKGNTIAQYEIGRNEPITAVFSLICKEFNVNEEWLKTGEGEMFNQMSRDEETMKYVAQIISDEDKPLKAAFLNAAAKIINDDRCYEVIEAELLSIIEEVKKRTR